MCYGLAARLNIVTASDARVLRVSISSPREILVSKSTLLRPVLLLASPILRLIRSRHSTMNRRQPSCTLLRRHALTIAMQSLQGPNTIADKLQRVLKVVALGWPVTREVQSWPIDTPVRRTPLARWATEMMYRCLHGLAHDTLSIIWLQLLKSLLVFFHISPIDIQAHHTPRWSPTQTVVGLFNALKLISG